jgi:hypothetical protein
MLDRKPIIQEYVDQIEQGWKVIKPAGSGDIDDECVIQKPSEYLEARPRLPVSWFEDEETTRIEHALRQALRRAKVNA